jgi:GNAT superfamily N-acetyltransferase
LTQTFTLRDATPGDEVLLLHLIRELAEYEHLLHEVEVTQAGLHAALFGPRPFADALIAQRGDEPVGYAMWYFSFNSFHGTPCLYVEDVFVRQAHRGHGIGRAIFADLARRALRHGCARMAWMVLDWNAPSIGFYRGLDAKPVEGWTTYGIDGSALAALAA